MTVTEETIENQDSTPVNGTAETTEYTTPEVKYPTFAELAKATWKLAFDLSSRGDEDTSRDFCVGGTNEFLETLELPSLGDVENLEHADEYLNAWLKFKHWRPTGELSPEDDQWYRNRLVQRLRHSLRNREPASRDIMNTWLVELGLEPIAPPPPPRHVGTYQVEYNASTVVNSAKIQEALRAVLPELNVQVTYTGRIR